MARHTEGCFERGRVNPSVAHATAPLSGAPGQLCPWRAHDRILHAYKQKALPHIIVQQRQTKTKYMLLSYRRYVERYIAGRRYVGILGLDVLAVLYHVHSAAVGGDYVGYSALGYREYVLGGGIGLGIGH